MKTAATYYKTHLQSAGWSSLEYLPNDYLKAFETAVAAIAADARADALAEKPAADADEERAKREYERFCEIHGKHIGQNCRDLWTAEFKAALAEYAATFPPRPMRTPGQRLFESEVAAGHFVATRLWSEQLDHVQESFETRAAALGIQSAE